MDRRTEPVRFIVIGAGQRGGDVYAAYALDNPQDAVVVGVAEPRGDRREALAAAHAIPKENVYKTGGRCLSGSGSPTRSSWRLRTRTTTPRR